jgi:hypothetical protein
MRSFGFDDAREERDSLPLDDRLQKAWKRYIAKNDDLCSRKKYTHSDLNPLLFQYARRILAPSRPTVPALHRHIIMTLPLFESDAGHREGWLYPADLGIFVSAGYQCLPEKEIIYDLDTPGLDGLGFLLHGKHLIIEGRAGDNVGECMVGRLTNNGELGGNAGIDMIGHFMNHGTLGHSPATSMIGCYTNMRRGTPAAMIFRGKQNRTWSIPKAQRAAFLRDIENPANLSYNSLSDKLAERYR